MSETWYNVARHYTGPKRSEEAIRSGAILCRRHGIMSPDIIPARSGAKRPSKACLLYTSKAEDIYFSYDDEKSHSLNGLSLEIERGRKVAGMGANGSGKSTFFLTCNGIHQPSRGTLYLDGKPIAYNRKGLLEARKKAVSYTHLDVYKRQPSARAWNAGGGRRQGRWLPAWELSLIHISVLFFLLGYGDRYKTRVLRSGV